jgi:aminoglycoside phosphotransferase (APT) family kinase protein
MRKGEELDAERLHAWLVKQVPCLQGRPTITQYSGGVSNWTYRVEYESHDLVLRRGPSGTKAKSAHDMGREYRLQRALAPVYRYVPEMIAYCDDPSLIGAEFYIMRRVPGIILRKNLPRGFELSPPMARALCTRLLDTLIELHRVDYEAAGLAHLGKGKGYVRRQIEGWSDRYRKARTWNVPKGDYVMDWLAERVPTEERICVTHNDFRFDNVVLDPSDPTRIAGVLDWELAALGDPLMELGNSLAYWVEAGDDPLGQYFRRQPTHLPGMLTRREVVEYYFDRVGVRPANMAFYEVYGLFRLSVIAQQVYYRYHRGETLQALLARGRVPPLSLFPNHSFVSRPNRRRVRPRRRRVRQGYALQAQEALRAGGATAVPLLTLTHSLTLYEPFVPMMLGAESTRPYALEPTTGTGRERQRLGRTESGRREEGSAPSYRARSVN